MVRAAWRVMFSSGPARAVAIIILGVVLLTLALFFSGSVGTLLRLFPPSILGVILFLTGAQLALGSCDLSKDKGERFVTVITARLPSGTLASPSWLGWRPTGSTSAAGCGCDRPAVHRATVQRTTARRPPTSRQGSPSSAQWKSLRIVHEEVSFTGHRIARR